jgi:hypothetical protein
VASVDRLRERLPSLWRPDAGEDGLLDRLLAAVGAPLDALRDRAGEVLRGHWFGYADRALYDPWVTAVRRRRGLAAQTPDDLVDLVDPAAAATALAGETPLASDLRAGFTPRTRELLAARQAGSPPAPALVRAMVGELSARVRGESLFSAERFADVELSAETRDLLATDPQGGELVRLNQRLLAEGFAGAVAAADLDHPYLDDLGRLGALLPLAPWQQPPALRETVEAYRLRVDRTVALYRDGLGTRPALARSVAAQLPVDLRAAFEERDRPFTVEERAPSGAVTAAVATRGAPDAVLGPLMRWTVDQAGEAPVVPTLYVQGVEPAADRVDAAVDPVIELFASGDGGERVRLGVAFAGTLGAGETLRLRPAFSSWLGAASGLLRARSLPAAATAADPTAPGPWNAAAGAPAGGVTALVQTRDRVLWAAFEGDGGGAVLGRFDGHAWSEALTALPAVHCLAEDGDDLLLGTAAGLLRMPQHPAEGDAFAAAPVAGLDDRAVFALLAAEAEGGGFWAGGERGVDRLAADGGVAGVGLTGELATPIAAIARDGTGALYFGGELGVFQHQPAAGRWYWFAGGERGDQVADWRELIPGPAAALPAPEAVFLPPVRSLLRGPDASLWLGTDRGLARYVAASLGGSSYDTRLEAVPELGAGAVAALAVDERDGVWAATEGGLLRFDGRDWWRPVGAGESWRRLGAAAVFFAGEALPRGAWRFVRGTAPADGSWQRFGRDWEDVAEEAPAAAAAAVRALAWTDEAAADLGAWDGSAFTPAADVEEALLAIRYKPSEDRVVSGGLAAVPRLPPGRSTWRYLRRESAAAGEPADRPAWTVEGRLLPPPAEAAPVEGRYDVDAPPASAFDQAVFAYPPAARVWLSWRPRRPLSVLVRLLRRRPGEALEPAVLDRVWQGIQQVRPAGAQVALALDEEVVRDGTAR